MDEIGRVAFVRNRERLNGCEIGETFRSKDCDRGRSIERRQVRFQATTSFSLTAPCKIDPFTRCSTISLFVFFSRFLSLFLFPPFFFFRRMSDPPLFSWRVHASPIPECREFPRVEITSCPDFHRVSGPPMENEHQRLPPSWTRIVSNFRRELTNE